MIMHDWSESDDRAILRKCYDALPSGGGHHLRAAGQRREDRPPAGRADEPQHAGRDDGGRNYTAAEYSRWLKDIGFRKMKTVRLKGAGADGAVIGIKP